MSCYSIEDVTIPTPGSPPDLTGSRSSKSSSLHSSSRSDDNEGIVTDITHFEEIALDDEERAELEDIMHEPDFKPYAANYVHELRTSAKRPVPRKAYSMQRELTTSKVRPSFPPPRMGHVRQPTADIVNGLLPGTTNPYAKRGLSSPITPTLGMMRRNRSASPNHRPVSPSSSIQGSPVSLAQRLRRGSWQSTKERKTIKQLEKECDEDDGDDLPDDVLLENVPMSPRPISERRRSQPPSPDNNLKKEKSRPAGNGTPPVPVAQGSLRSPLGPAKPPMANRGISMGQFPINHTNFKQPRAKSWTAALSDLNDEARALTEALEAHADEQLERPRPKRSVSSAPAEKRRVQSSIAELPPLRTKDIMIDPLPISREKEAVLSRTRPSWLPPKNPLEEKKHLREYQKMMAQSLEAEKKRQIERRDREMCKDNTASSLLRIWEEHVMPNWDAVVPMKRTRELWWRGIAPRSRGAVWQRAVGNELGLSEASYEAALNRAKTLEKKLAKGTGDEEEARQGRWLASIQKDVSATFPELQIFQFGGPLYQTLTDVAMAYCMYRADVGYVTGLNTIVALLLLNLPTPASTFVTLCNLLNRSLPNAFLTHDPIATSKYLNLAITTLNAKLPTLTNHLNSPEHPTIALSTQPDIYLNEAFTSLFTKSLDLESMTRLWDVWVFEGDAVLIRAAVALFSCTENKIYGCDTKEEVLAILEQPGVGMSDNTADEERWMRAVRDAGRGTKSQVATLTPGNGATSNGLHSPGLQSPASTS